MRRTLRFQDKQPKGLFAVLGLFSLGLVGSVTYAQVPAQAQSLAPTPAQCDSYENNYGNGDMNTSLIVKQCCDSVFSSAPPSMQSQTTFGSRLFSAAGQGRLLCVDQFKPSANPSVAPQFVRRNVFTGSKSKLTNITALLFANGSANPALIVANDSGGVNQILTLNPLLDGNIPPDSELWIRDLPLTVAMAADVASNELIVLGADGTVRLVSLNYNDLSLKPANHSKIDQWMGSASPMASPVAMAYSVLLQRILVLTSDGQVHLLARSQQGLAGLEPGLQVLDISKPVGISVIENATANTVTVVVQGADGMTWQTVLQLNLPTPTPSSTPSPTPSSGL